MLNRLFVIVTTLLATNIASAGSIVPCGQDECTSYFSMYVDGNSQAVGGAQFIYDAETGEIRLDTEHNIHGGGVATQSGGLLWDLGDGAVIRVNDINGNADPILGFGVGASTGAVGRSFTFAFNLPISITGQIMAQSSVSYSLTANNNNGAQVSPFSTPKIVAARDVDSDFPVMPALNKNVDVGDAFGFATTPGLVGETRNSPVYVAKNLIVGDYDYDIMSVQVSFSLTANSSVGISGFVSQTEVPLPAALPLFLFALSSLVTLLKFRKSKLHRV